MQWTVRRERSNHGILSLLNRTLKLDRGTVVPEELSQLITRRLNSRNIRLLRYLATELGVATASIDQMYQPALVNAVATIKKSFRTKAKEHSAS